MNKRAFLQAIEAPFKETFTPEIIKKAFKITGLHPLDPSVIRPEQMAPSTATAHHGPSLIDEPSPCKAMRVAFNDLLTTSTPPLPSFLVTNPALSLSSNSPPPSTASLDDAPMSSLEPLDTRSPQQVAQELLQGTSAEWIVSNQPITVNDTLKPYHTPPVDSLQAPPMTLLPQYPSKDPSPGEINALINENSALRKHIDTLNQVIASQRVQLTLATMAFNKTKNQLHEKARGTQDKARQKLFDGKAQIVTAPEFKQLVHQLEEKHQLEKDEKAARAAARVAKAAVKAAEAQAKRDAMDKYEQDMTAWRDECAILSANGKCGKALPPKPPHPFKGRRGKRPPLPVIDHTPRPEPMARPCRAAAPTKVLVDTVEYSDDSEYADTDMDNDE